MIQVSIPIVRCSALRLLQDSNTTEVHEQGIPNMKRASLYLLGTVAIVALGSTLSGCDQGPGPRKTPVEASQMLENPQEGSGASISGSKDG